MAFIKGLTKLCHIDIANSKNDIQEFKYVEKCWIQKVKKRLKNYEYMIPLVYVQNRQLHRHRK